MTDENEGQSTLVEIETPQIGASSDEKGNTANEAAKDTTSDGSADQADEIEGEEGEGDEGKPKKRSRWERERRARERLIAENAALKERQRALEQAQAANNRPADSEPRQEDFADFFDYIEARAAWRAEQSLSAKMSQERQSIEATRSQEAKISKFKEYEKRVADFASTVPDFHDVIETSPDIPAGVLSLVEEAVLDSDVGPQMVYALAKDEDLLLRIARMSPTRAAIELGKLEARLTQTKPKTQTNAPAPITRLKGGGASAPKDISKMSMEEYRAYRNSGKS